MESRTIQEAESVTRSIARWGSIAAAIIFALGFVTDKNLSWHIVAGQAVNIILVVAIFAGYALAWTKRFEALGSLIALLALGAVCMLCWRQAEFLPEPIFFAVGVPALLHLVAIALHRYALPGGNAKM